MAHEFRMPDIGEGLTEAEIVAWLVDPGDTVTVDQPIVEVETAKTTVEIPAPFAGTIIELVGSPGDTVEVGEVLFVIGGDEPEDAPDEPEAATGSIAADSRRSPAAVPSAGASAVRAMPAVRRLAKDLGVDLSTVSGSGPGGSITRADVEAAAASDGSGGPTPLSSVRRAIARHMAESWTTIPHVTVQAEVRAEHLLADRGIRADARLPLEALIGVAVAPLLRRYPEFNAAYVDDAIDVATDIHLGFAVDTDAGLMVIVVRHADTLGLVGLAEEVERLARAARDRTIAPDDTGGQTFTISNIGALGGGHGTPIIPMGTSAILSVGRAGPQPVVEDGELAVGMVAPLDLSYDHRLIDGALGQRFLGDLVQALETPYADR